MKIVLILHSIFQNIEKYETILPQNVITILIYKPENDQNKAQHGKLQTFNFYEQRQNFL